MTLTKEPNILDGHAEQWTLFPEKMGRTTPLLPLSGIYFYPGGEEDIKLIMRVNNIDDFNHLGICIGGIGESIDNVVSQDRDNLTITIRGEIAAELAYAVARRGGDFDGARHFHTFLDKTLSR